MKKSRLQSQAYTLLMRANDLIHVSQGWCYSPFDSRFVLIFDHSAGIADLPLD
jgi:hypothetical protein